MIKKKYLEQIKRTVKKQIGQPQVRVFLFGSSLRQDHFGDCDIGIMGGATSAEIRRLKNQFAESTLPYAVDVVNFDTAAPSFRRQVFKQPILWIKSSS